MPTEIPNDHPDRIEKFFEGKVVLITGATGFLGKVLLEKLLRACPKVKTVITLIRTKKGKTPKERLGELFSSPLFNSLKEQYGPDHLNKVVAIKANIADEDLDLSREDLTRLCEEVQIVVHCAATVRFDEPLKTTVLLNVRGTKKMLDLAKNMINLQLFQYISTAYCHMEETELFEKIYDAPGNPHQIIKICEWLRTEDIELLASRLMGKVPNPYAYSKALAEALVVEQMKNLPVQLLRPSIVVPIYKEPIPGWTDNLNGPAGLLLGAGRGVIRTMHLKGNICSDFMPVDIVANAILFIAFLTSINIEQRIFHITCNKEKKVSYNELIERGKEILWNKVPLPGAVWYPGGSPTTSKLYNRFRIFLYHSVPAVIVDALLYVLGYQPVLMKVQRRINKGFDMLHYYANHEWSFRNDTILEMRKLMNPTEKMKYTLDSEGFDINEYILNCIISIRRYLMKEPDETIPSSRRHLKILWVIDRMCKIIFVSLFIYVLYTQLLVRFLF